MATSEEKKTTRSRSKKTAETPATATTEKKSRKKSSKDQQEQKETVKKPIDQRLVFVSCKNSDFKKKVEELAKSEEIDVVTLEDKIVTDYIEIAENNVPDRMKKVSLKQFLENATNKVQAEGQCKKLYDILTNRGKNDKGIYTRTEMVKATTLSHVKASMLLKLFQAFSLIRFTKGDYEFQFIDDKDIRRILVEADIKVVLDSLNDCIVKYMDLVNNDDNLSKEEKAKKEKELMELVNERISF